MIVIVKNIIDDTEEAFSGREEQVENGLRQAFPEIARPISIGDLDGLLFELSAHHGLLLEIPEGHVAKPELHLPIRFDTEPHTCGPLCNGLSKSDDEGSFSDHAASWILEKAIADITPGENTTEKALAGRNGHTHPAGVQTFDYSHVVPEHLRHNYRIELHEHPRGADGKPNHVKLEAFLIRHPFNFARDDIGKASGSITGKHRNGDKDLKIALAEINDHGSRGKGLGTALYEALLAHAKHYHGATHVAGGDHSTLAHNAHERLSKRHGMEYSAWQNDQDPEDQEFHRELQGEHGWDNGEFDDAYGPYMYAIKSETPLVKNIHFKEAGFRNIKTGEIAGTGFFHNIYELPESWSVDEDHLEGIEAGFIDHGGKFYNRSEAAAKVNQATPVQSEDLDGMGRKEGEEHLGGGAGLVKAIGDIPQGSEKRGQKKYGLTRFAKFFDYQHILSPLQKRHYFLTIRPKPDFYPAWEVRIHSRRVKDAHGWPTMIGSADMHVGVPPSKRDSPDLDPNYQAVVVSNIRLHNAYRGKGLGTAMYEAGFAHAKHVHHATHVFGGAHSTAAHGVHEKLAAKHGLAYSAPATEHKGLDKDFDGAYGQYEYELKTEPKFTKSDDSLLALASNLSNASNDDDNELAEDMSGFAPKVHTAFEAARFLINGQTLTLDQVRRALWQEDGDFERAALVAYGIDPDESNLKALRAVMTLSGMEKNEPREQEFEVDCPNEFSTAACSEVQRGFDSRLVQHVNLNGKYSKGSMVVRDPKSAHVYLLKPDSEGRSPAAGMGEEPAVSQPRREAAYWQIANLLGLGGGIPRADLIMVNHEEWAAIRLLPYNFKNLEKRWRSQQAQVMNTLERYRAQGLLHKWAVLDFILGNPDRHGQNLMIGHDEKMAPIDNEIALIDHGSAFAGYAFAPSSDANSFIPFYLRAWAQQKGFNKSPPEDKLRQMPTVNYEVNRMLKSWIEQIDPKRIERLVKQFGIDPGPVLSRLSRLRALPDQPDIAINKLWAGAA